MTLPALSLTAHDGYLSTSETDALIRDAQNVSCAVDPADPNRFIYGTTPESERALETLTTAYLPLIHKIARTSSILDFDDALMVCLEEFISVVRRYEVGSALPFVAGLGTILSRKIGDTGRTSGLVVVKENAAARYRQIMDRHEWNLEAAYDECKNTTNGFTPETFMAVHNALSIGSLDLPLDDDPTKPNGVANGGTNRLTGREADLTDGAPNPEASTVQAELIRWLFTIVTPKQQQILRLRYGFNDLATENARLAAGFRADKDDLVMSDRQVAQVIGSTTPTVNRQRAEALRLMRFALEDAENA